ncbi:MAG: hypothetical protein ACTHJ5_18775 [Ilyomonas sp.]
MNNDFKNYAKQRLKEHEAELNTRYQNENISKEEKKKAVEEHVQLLKKELQEKASSNDNIDEYINRLQQSFK